MRRIGLLLLTLTALGCEALRDAFSAHADVAARVPGYTLSSDRLAELVAHAKRVPVTMPAVSSVAQLWVDYALFALAVARGDSLRDSATVLAATWPLVAQLKWAHFHDRLSVRQASLSDRQVDSAFEAGSARMFQHILLRVPPDAGPAVERRKHDSIVELQRQIRRGANFARLAAQASDDPSTKARGGYLAVTERGDPLVPEFADAAWALAPGQVSNVVRSAYGFHLIRRPPLREVRLPYHAGLEARMQRRLDSLVVDSLSSGRDIKVVKNAPAMVRDAVTRLQDAWRDDRVLVTFRGGPFRVSDLARWLHAVDPQVLQGLPSATDEQLDDFLRLITQRQILVVVADSAGVTLDSSDLAGLRLEHDSALAILRSTLQLTPETLPDSGTEVRSRAAVAQVNDYLERMLTGRAAFIPVPPFLGATLRERAEWNVSAAGVTQAVERATAARSAADSLSGGGGNEGGGLQPAAGPPPVPGASGGRE